MKQVLQVSRLLTVTADLDLLLRRIAEATCEMLDCERASIFLHDPVMDQLWTKVALQSHEIRVPASAGIVGHAFKNNALLHVAKPYEDPRFNPEPDRKSGFVTRNLLTCPMPDMNGKPVGVIQAVNKKTGAFDDVDEAIVELLSDQAGVAIQRYNLQRSAVEAVALRREMDLAKEVQKALIPATMPEVDGIESTGWAQTASITGGDCFDLWKTPDGRLGIFLGDATGHGIGPAMVVSQTRTLIRAMCSIHDDPRSLLACANARLSEDLGIGQFVTAFAGFLAPDGRLEWCSAGHGPIIIRDSQDAPFEAFDASAPPLGVMPDFLADPVINHNFGVGGMICITSDGINEAFSPTGEQLGVERLLKLLSDANPNATLTEIGQSIRTATRDWQQNDEPKDDQTVVLAARRR